MKVVLEDVTLVAIDTVCPELTEMAIQDCLKHVEPDEVRVFNSSNLKVPATKEGLLGFAIYELPFLIKSKFIFFIHWDSWVIDPEMWTNEFLNYDYIGAPWWYKDGLNVGNSGFSIRSTDLMRFVAENKNSFPIYEPEDDVLCRRYRPLLQQFHWAPESLAQQFAFERTRPSISSRHFGFHGLFNWPFVLTPD